MRSVLCLQRSLVEKALIHHDVAAATHHRHGMHLQDTELCLSCSVLGDGGNPGAICERRRSEGHLHWQVQELSAVSDRDLLLFVGHVGIFILAAQVDPAGRGVIHKRLRGGYAETVGRFAQVDRGDARVEVFGCIWLSRLVFGRFGVADLRGAVDLAGAARADRRGCLSFCLPRRERTSSMRPSPAPARIALGQKPRT